jgi:hypothetical protein
MNEMNRIDNSPRMHALLWRSHMKNKSDLDLSFLPVQRGLGCWLGADLEQSVGVGPMRTTYDVGILTE